MLESLKKAGKLINQLSIADINKLPASFKGYELYSWNEDNCWHFTLITGTNRNKTMEEITSKKDYVSEAGWVKVQVVGADAIKEVLGRLPRGESVFWSGELHIEQTSPTNISLQLPPAQIVADVQSYTLQSGLNLSISAR